MSDAEIAQLRQHDKEATDLTIDQQVEIGRLRTALVQIENWVGELPSNLGEAALVFEYIDKACKEALSRGL